MPRSAANRTTSVMSSGDITAPDGFDGEFRMINFVRGVTRRETISAVTRKPAASSLCSITQLPPA